MLRPVTPDPLEGKIFIRHLNGTNNKILNNIHYNKSFTLSGDHYFQEKNRTISDSFYSTSTK